MYSKEVEKKLSEKGIEVGDEVKVVKGSESFKGILMPQTRLGDSGCLVVKLPNGYNVGVDAQGASIELVSKGKGVEFKPAKMPAQEGSKPLVSILGCGGTIASRVEYKTGAVFPAFEPADLLLSFPRLAGIARIKGRKVFSLLSEDMSPAHWKLMAEEVESEVKEGVEGVVLMHGTDTMGYSSAALSFMLRDLPVPVVFVGAQRSSDRGSSDNEMNVVCAVQAACSPIAEVGVCMHSSSNDDYCFLHKGTKVRKMHTSRRDAFKSVNAKPLAKIGFEKGDVEALSPYSERSSKRKLKLETKMNENVCLIWVHPGIQPKFVESLSSFDGVVLAGTGLGHVPTNPFNDKHAKSVLPAVKSLVERDIPVVIAPQTLFGRLDLNVYTAGRMLNEAGVIGDGCDWLPETAFVKLMWALGKTRKQSEVRKLMNENIAGELSERSDACGAE